MIRLLAASAGLLVLAGVMTAAPAEGASHPAGATLGDEKGVNSTDKNKAPISVLSGSRTQLASPDAIAHRKGRTYVKSHLGNFRFQILVYRKHARGNAAPVRVIKGRKPGTLGTMYGGGLAVDRRGRIYSTTSVKLADGDWHWVIAVFGRKAHGNVAPKRVITNEAFPEFTACDETLRAAFAGGLVVGRDGTIYATTNGGCGDYENDGVAVFAPGASGAAAPVRWIHGAGTLLHDPSSVLPDRAGNLWVTGSFESQLLRFAAGADGAAVPDRVVISSYEGGQDGPPNLAGPTLCGLDDAGNVYVANRKRIGDLPPVTAFAPDADGEAPALARLTGSRTQLAASRACALDGKGRVIVALINKNAVNTYAPLVRQY